MQEVAKKSPSNLWKALHVPILHFRVYFPKLGGWFPVAEFGFISSPSSFKYYYYRSHRRGRRQQARGTRGSIEIAKCGIFRTNCATLNVTNSRGNPQICA